MLPAFHAMPAPLQQQTLGHLAAAGTALCWAGTSLCFAAASRRVGSFHVNQIRLVLACGLLAAACGLAGVYAAIPPAQLALLALSGVMGLVLGDSAGFHALQVLGARRTSLVMSLCPGFTVVLMTPLLSERLDARALAGMALTWAGVLWASREPGHPGEIEGSAAAGLALGLVAAFGQAAGLVLSKAGLGAAPPGSPLAAMTPGAATVHPLLGTLVRIGTGAACLVGLSAVRGRLGGSLRAAGDRPAFWWTLGGTVFGPVVGVTLSLVAVTLANTGVAATIMATSPLLVIALVRLVHGHPVTARALLGAVVAVAGVALLTLRG